MFLQPMVLKAKKIKDFSVTETVKNLFSQYQEVSDGVLCLRFNRCLTGARAMAGVPAHLYDILLEKSQQVIGDIDLRVGRARYLELYGGQLGYRIEQAFQGQRFAARACELMKQVAEGHGMEKLWITCNPENLASRKTCEIIGAQYINMVKVPIGSELYWRGDRFKCRYLWDLNPGN